MAIPENNEPERPEGGDGERDGGEAARPVEPVADAQWNALVQDLIGPGEARGTHDSFVIGTDAADEAGQDAADPMAADPVTELSETGLLGSAVVRVAATSWRRMLAATDRLLRRQPATLMLPPGTKARFTIGREPGCDMTLLDRTVSRLHASLKREGDGWLLTDLGSTNGTRLNGWRVTTPIVVCAGDLVSFGAATFVLADRPQRRD